jgi:hypothetical protein
MCFLQQRSTSHTGIDTVFTKDGIFILANVVIIDPTRANLFCWSYTTWRFVASKVIQAKEKSYHEQHPTNHFLPLAINVFGCLDKQAHVILHNCANAMSNFKGPKGHPLYVLVFFFGQNISITLQRMQASSILSWVVVIGVTTSQLPPFQDTSPITTADLLEVVNCWDKDILTFSLC